MTGNSIEEGLMLQIGNPSHLDRGRIAVPAGAIVGGVLAFMIDGPVWLRLLIGGLAGVTVFIMLYRHLGQRALQRAAQQQEAARQERIKSVERQLSETGSSGKAG